MRLPGALFGSSLRACLRGAGRRFLTFARPCFAVPPEWTTAQCGAQLNCDSHPNIIVTNVNLQVSARIADLNCWASARWQEAVSPV